MTITSPEIAARAEESRQLARVHTLRLKTKDRRRYDSNTKWYLTLRKSRMVYTPVKKSSLRKTLKKVFRTVSGATPFISRDLRSTRFLILLHERKLREVVHVLRMKPYHDPAEQIETEDIPPKESYKGPITRSRIKTLEQNDSGALSSFRGAMPHA
ncbi:hypothetical protein TNCV_1835941 [Trichonephila clavipes]|nr:hypothetical protein TNCV_1835941 [Trichonephila clavipes]